MGRLAYAAAATREASFWFTEHTVLGRRGLLFRGRVFSFFSFFLFGYGPHLDMAASEVLLAGLRRIPNKADFLCAFAWFDL
jgi:hypothetical protein